MFTFETERKNVNSQCWNLCTKDLIQQGVAYEYLIFLAVCVNVYCVMWYVLGCWWWWRYGHVWSQLAVVVIFGLGWAVVVVLVEGLLAPLCHTASIALLFVTSTSGGWSCVVYYSKNYRSRVSLGDCHLYRVSYSVAIFLTVVRGRPVRTESDSFGTVLHNRGYCAVSRTSVCTPINVKVGISLVMDCDLTCLLVLETNFSVLVFP